jgi:hypothetical protein
VKRYLDWARNGSQAFDDELASGIRFPGYQINHVTVAAWSRFVYIYLEGRFDFPLALPQTTPTTTTSLSPKPEI